MDLGHLPPRPLGLGSAAARDCPFRALRLLEAALPRCSLWPAALVLAAASVVWLPYFVDLSFGYLRVVAAVCSASFAATGILAAGWTAEPENLQRWSFRALVGAIASACGVLLAG